MTIGKNFLKYKEMKNKKGGLMLKKVLLGALVLLFIVGCGPKQATDEQISELQEKQQSVQTLDTGIKNFDQQKQDLQKQKVEKENTIEELQKQKDELEKKLK